MQLCLIRHPWVDAQQRCYGQLELNVQQEGLSQALSQLAPFKQQQLISSPAQRCQQLAYALSAHVELWSELQELDFGDWEGRRWQDIPRTELDDWAADLWHYPVGGGETVLAFRSRVLHAVQRAHTLQREQVVWVTHAGVIRMLLAEYQQIPSEQRWTVPIDYATPYWLNITSF
ncbi:MAG: histidine phosphatase family protein [Pseudomonadota bacterium]|nr:histidine phosphatase family protein [Pseudomonadota bacterium]